MKCCFRNGPKEDILKGRAIMLLTFGNKLCVWTAYKALKSCLNGQFTHFWKSWIRIKSCISRCLQHQSGNFALTHNMPDSSYQESSRNILCGLLCNADILAQHFITLKAEGQMLLLNKKPYGVSQRSHSFPEPMASD